MRPQLELLAIHLYREAIVKSKPKLEAIKMPLWVELGTTMRNTYRSAALELLHEQRSAFPMDDNYRELLG